MASVNVIIPAYNQAAVLRRAVEGVLSQTYTDLTVIIVDDGSTDNTEHVVKDIDDNRIVYVKSAKNSGPSAARNCGIALSKDEYIAILDSDDEWLPEKIQKQVSLMKGLDEEWGVCLTGGIIVKDGSRQAVLRPDLRLKGNVYKQFVLSKIPFLTSSLLFRRSCLEGIGGFDTELWQAEDSDLLMRVLKGYKLAVIHEPLVVWHLNTIKVMSPDKVKKAQLLLIIKHERDIRRLGWHTLRRFRGRRFWIIAQGQLRSGRFKSGFFWLARSLWEDPAAFPHYSIRAIIIATGLVNAIKHVMRRLHKLPRFQQRYGGEPGSVMKAKVLLIHNILWSQYKAAVFSALNDILDKKEFDFSVLQIAVTETRRKSLGDFDVSCHRYPYTLLFDSGFEEVGFLRKTCAIFRHLSTRDYDIAVIPGYADSIYWWALLISRVRRRKVIIAFDSTEQDRPRVWYKELSKRAFIAWCDGAFAYGTRSRDYLLKLGMAPEAVRAGCQATDNHAIEAGYASALSLRTELLGKHGFRQFNFIYVGRLSAEKNVDTLLLAFGRVKRGNTHGDSWGLIIVGDGPEKDRLRRLASGQAVEDVHFVGGQPWKRVPTYYALSNVLVLPSFSEPWGLVVNEAMVCGLPVVVSDRCGAACDLVRDGENGFVFDARDVAALSDRLSYYVDAPQESGRMGARSREIISGYTPLHAARQMREGLQRVRGARLKELP
jgi:glycosyltransferase involved in cell wall biosynthesis